MTLLYCPLCTSVDEALDWFEERGCVDVTLWRGPDGLVRGSGRRK